MSAKQDYGLPESVKIIKHAGGIELKRYWRSWRSVSYLAFGILWFGFLYREGPMALQDIPYAEHLQVLLLSVGGIIAYYGLAQIFNYSSVRTFSDRLKITHRPLPLLLGKTFKRADIKQLYVNRHHRRGENGTIITYELRLLSHGGKDYCLLKNVPEKQSVKYIEQEIEQYWGIKNEAVKGEVSN
ncbi:hypothetical protein [uncultured Pseudoteredinibacter sp.]|uniref:hypothetical protein n=1 Tax=uncultured Pseudoteredinibacter sp. TaxID=1641701 RepID=UPI002616AE00|nr:hypothetical protein [uncultured Pseudoteredinibacter sp.]